MSWRQIQRILLAAATLALCSPSPGQSSGQASKIALDQGAAGSTVTLQNNQRLTVSLPGNPTTGFVWELMPGAEAILARRGEPHFAPGSTTPGAGGVYCFCFQAVAPGSAPLKFIYHRPFEKDVTAARSFEVTIVIAK